MHAYRTHTCGVLGVEDQGKTVKISGWIHSKRDHGGLLFIDLRDYSGITQCVFAAGSEPLKVLEGLRVESVITVQGEVKLRVGSTVNTKIPTGTIEVVVSSVQVISAADVLPIQVAGEHAYPEELRLRYRYLDLRRERLQKTMLLRARIIESMRERMIAKTFTEFQTPILTVSSPEGARDFLVPARLHPGKFYALPQAPQQFKQLCMVAGFDRYFQIAPCFRDEAGRADRTLVFYQLDVEMSFVEQEDVFQCMEPTVQGIFKEFAGDRKISDQAWPRIPYKQALLDYGTDKPDLRNPLIIHDASSLFDGCDFELFASIVKGGGVIRCIRAPNAATRSRKFYDGLNEWAREQGAGGLGYIVPSDLTRGPIAKKLDWERIEKICGLVGAEKDDAVFFMAGSVDEVVKLAGAARTRIAVELDLIEKDCFKFCWIVDFPMYELDEENSGDGKDREKIAKYDFCHNPFSMIQGEMESLDQLDPLDIKAYQYDIVCNGYELASGAIRNHRPDIMIRAFAIAGYSSEQVSERFGGMLDAFRYGAPPHGGMAAGIDRIVMLLADEPNLREVNLFPMNQQGEDLMLGAPSTVSDQQLKELSIELKKPVKLLKSNVSFQQ